MARLPIGGGTPRQVLEGVEFADWTTDGSRLAVVREFDRRDRLEFPPGKTLHESHWIENPRISPSGDRIAFIDHLGITNNGGAIAVVDLAGKKTTLSDGWYDAGGLAWSADGHEVWFTASRKGSARQLHAVTLRGEERFVAEVPGQLILQDIFRDGRVLLVVRQPRREVVGRFTGMAEERNFSWLDSTTLGGLSSDGKLLLFSEESEGGGPQGSLYLRRMSGAFPTRLGDGVGWGLSPDGRWALAASLGKAPQELDLVPTGTGETKRLLPGTVATYDWACWFPDGQRILIFGNEAERPPRLFIQDVRRGEPRALTPEGTRTSRFGSSMVTPDGLFVAGVELARADTRYVLYPVDGGAPHPISGIDIGEEPMQWSADGRFLFVRATEQFQYLVRIARLDLRTGRRQPWKELRPADPAGVLDIKWTLLTPDGRSYFYNYDRRLSDLYLAEGLR